MSSFLAIDLAACNRGARLHDTEFDETYVVCCRASIGTRNDTSYGEWLGEHLESPQSRWFGAYHVVTNDDPRDQLYIYNKTVGDSSELWPVLDIERPELHADSIRACIDTFVAEHGRVVIYTYQSYITVQRFEGYGHLPLWLAYYPRNMPMEVLDNDASTTPVAPIPRAVWDRATIWQLNGNDTQTSRFRLSGVDVDLSVGYNLNAITRVGYGA